MLFKFLDLSVSMPPVTLSPQYRDGFFLIYTEPESNLTFNPEFT
jgi:hypothetical protein